VSRIEALQGVEPYPEGYWHITIKGLGFELETPNKPDDVARSRVESIAAAARTVFAGQTAFETRIGLAGGFQEVVIAEVWDGLPVRELNERLLETVPGLVRYPFDGPHFLPHVSLARFTSNAALPALKDAIDHLREEAPGPPFRVREVQFIRARLSTSAPAFQTIETYQLQ
jgi:2'-5' RNA ligase